MGASFCANDNRFEDDLVSVWNRCSLAIERYTDAYIDIMTNSNPKEMDFEEQQTILAALIMGIKLSLIWETVYEQLVIPVLTLEPEEQAQSNKAFQTFEHELSDIKVFLEELGKHELDSKQKDEILNISIRLAKILKAYNASRRKLINSDMIGMIPEEQRAQVLNHVIKRVNILSRLQFVSIESFTHLHESRAENNMVVQPDF